jgi:sodium/potassium/calcium exchanger 2
MNRNQTCASSLVSQTSTSYVHFKLKPCYHQFKLKAKVFTFIGLIFLSVISKSIIKLYFDHQMNSRFRQSHSDRILKVTPSFENAEHNEEYDNKLLVLVSVGVLYMIVAIAIVCDEFFVPALEEIASENYLDLSMDVAGATLMAAGGSAPELFTSLIGTFSGSEIGFGTIVGSAVFNVLFVIGMCAVCSKSVLNLTWWPLFRDCTYYAVTLGMLASFCGYFSPNQIEMWEALFMLVLYVGYVIFMKYNEEIYTRISRGFQQSKVVDETCTNRKMVNSSWKPNSFRAGLLNFLMGKGSLVDKVGCAIVTKISGDVNAVFRKLDMSGDGYIDHDEFKTMVEMLDTVMTEEDVDHALEYLDDNRDGMVSDTAKLNVSQFSAL